MVTFDESKISELNLEVLGGCNEGLYLTFLFDPLLLGCLLLLTRERCLFGVLLTRPLFGLQSVLILTVLLPMVILEITLLIHAESNTRWDHLNANGLLGVNLHGAMEVRFSEATAYVQEGRLLGLEVVLA
jgi:hypothetical protein